MAKAKNGTSTAVEENNARLVTNDEDRAKASKWFQRARELGDKRQFDYAIEYYVNGLEFWPDAVEEACKPLHGCGVARKHMGGKKPGLKDTMKRSMNDKDARKALLNALWLFGHDPASTGYIEGIIKGATRLGADDAAKWAAGVFLKALDTAQKVNLKQFQSLALLLEGLGDRAAERGEATFGVSVYEMGVEALNQWRRRSPRDGKIDTAIKNLSGKLTILKGQYEKSESFRESIVDSQEQKDLHDEQRSVQSDERMDELIAKAETERKQNPDAPLALKNLVDLLCRREREDEETRAIGLLVEEFNKSGEYGCKHRADDVRMKQLARRVRALAKLGDPAKLKEHRIAQLRFELTAFKERVERYPTDHRIRFEYAVRNFQAGRFDEAIPLFQSARADPKNRAACGMYVGRCFFRKGYHAQAISALQEAIGEYEIGDDMLAKTMCYWLGRAQEAAGQRNQASETYGNLLRIDYNFSDARARLDALPQAG